MTQAALKQKPLTSGPKPKRGKAAGITKRGSRVVAPKKAKVVDKHNFAKKLNAQMIDATEKRLAARVGHLELLEGGKRDKKKSAAAVAAAAVQGAPPPQK